MAAMNSVIVKHDRFDSTKRVGLVVFTAAVRERNAGRLDGYLIDLPTGERREFSRCGDVMLMLCEELAEMARKRGRDIVVRRNAGQCLITLF